MSENRTGKYLKYALGEVLLVMIGILLALQVNNWNEERNKKEKEKDILNDFHAELSLNLGMIQEFQSVHIRAVKSMDALLEHIENDFPYHDSLKFHFGNTTHIWEQELIAGVFETLKSVGFDLIENKELRSCLLITYESNNLDLRESGNRYHNMVSNASQSLFNSRFDQYWKGDLNDTTLTLKMVPNNYELLKKDEEYLYFLRSLRNQHNWYMTRPFEKIKSSIIECLTLIEEELHLLD